MSLNLEVEVDVPFTFDYEALAGEVVAFTIDHEEIGRASCRERV